MDVASIRKRGTKWQAQVRVKGHLPLAKSFSRRDLAVAWARQKETEIERGDTPASVHLLNSITLSEILDRYALEVTSKKRGRHSEAYSIKTIRSHRIARLTLAALTSEEVATFRDHRLGMVSSGSVRRQLDVLRHCLSVAKRDWGIPLRSNPVSEITLPRPSRPRTRRLSAAERQRLLQHCGTGPTYLRPIIVLAIETGMRRSEIVGLEWSNIDGENRTAFLPTTKNGDSRLVPLSPDALEILARLPRDSPRVFPGLTGNAVRLAWERLRRRADLDDFRFHDLRHEAISALFEKGLNMPEVALVSGHKDARMLFRYTHLLAKDIALKL